MNDFIGLDKDLHFAEGAGPDAVSLSVLLQPFFALPPVVKELFQRISVRPLIFGAIHCLFAICALDLGGPIEIRLQALLS